MTTPLARFSRRRSSADEAQDRSIVSPLDRSRPGVRLALGILAFALVGSLIVVSGGPLLWLAKSAISSTQDIVRDPFGWFPSGVQWVNLVDAWTKARFGDYLLNTAWVAVGSWIAGLVVALTGGYVLSVLRPRFARVLSAAVLATLFVPGVISLIPLYLTVLDMPLLGLNLINTYWAVWLPAAASAFNVLLVTRFFDSLPRDIFDAARIDGAGPFTVFWHIVLPLSKPIIATVSLLTTIAAWKEFLWPLLVLTSPDLQPLSVALYQVVELLPLDLQVAGMLISVVVPIALFLIFQRQFLRGVGQSGALKG